MRWIGGWVLARIRASGRILRVEYNIMYWLRAGAALALWVVALWADVVSAADPESLVSASRLAEQGRLSQALENVDRYLSAHPRDAQARFLKGVILTGQKETPAAIQVFTELTRDYPRSPEPYNNLAVLYAAQGETDKAKQALEAALNTHPAYATAHANLRDLYAGLASQAYGRALQHGTRQQSPPTRLALIEGWSTPGVAPTAVTVAVAPTSGPRAPPMAVASASDSTREIQRVLKRWAEAWSQQKVQRYLEVYAADFQPADGTDLEAWKALRASRIEAARSIQIVLV
ncbi:MAG: Wzy polymerase domain-containing protein, partial [Burkholderiales bacterium]